MFRFNNETVMPESNFKSIVRNILLYTGFFNAETGYSFKYVESIDRVKGEGIFVVRDDKTAQGFVESLEIVNDFFIPNKKNYIGFDSSKSGMILSQGNSYVLSFDIFSFLLKNYSSELKFRKKSDFILFQNFQRTAYIDNMLLMLKEELKHIVVESGHLYAELEISGRGCYFLPTFDLDRVEYFNYMKNAYHSARAIFLNDSKSKKYLELRKSNRDDIWDKLDEIYDKMNKKKLKGLYFFFTVKRDIFARRYSLKKARNMAQMIPEGSAAGVHLKYESALNYENVKKQIESMLKIFKGDIYTRYHYLHNISVNEAKILDSSGVFADSSIGLKNAVGFKNGCAKPYYIPNTNIIEFPVTAMESALHFEEIRGYDYKGRLDETARACSKSCGVFTTIFHPSSLDENTYSGYAKYLDMFIDCSEKYKMINSSIKEISAKFSDFSDYVIFKNNSVAVDIKSPFGINILYGKEVYFVKPGDSKNLKEEK